MLAVHRYWARFRTRLAALQERPRLSYGIAGVDAPDFRFSGSFESADEGTLWIRGERLTVPIELSGAQLFLLDGGMRSIRWEELETLSEGSRIFVGGPVVMEGGQQRFVSRENRKLIVILYEGEAQNLFEQAIRAGRQENGYWNHASPYSIAVGVFAELLFALSLAGRPALSFAGALALTSALAPLFPFIPPAFPLVGLSRRLLGKAVQLQAEADVQRLTHRETAVTSLTEKRKARLLQTGAAGLCLAGIVINSLICFLLVRQLR